MSRWLAVIAILASLGCAHKPAIVERVRTVEVPVPVTTPIPETLVQACPAQGDLVTLGEYMDWLTQCVALSQFQLEKLRALPR